MPLFTLTLVFAPARASAQPVYKSLAPANYKIPAAQMQNWASRLKKLCPPTGWTTAVEGNDVLISCEKPINFKGAESPVNRKAFRLRLRFLPAVTLARYDALAAENKLAEGKKTALLHKHELFEVFDELGELMETNNLEARRQAYYAESKKLSFHLLPDFYAPDASVALYYSWRWYENPDPNDPAEKECKAVTDSLIRFFGTYNQQAAVGKAPLGREEPKAK